MSLRPSDFQTAKANYKPMKRGSLAQNRPVARFPETAPNNSDGTKRALPAATGLKRTGIKARAGKKQGRKLTTGQLKRKVWVQFSIFIRTRGADSEGINTCVTCDRRLHWKFLQAGHFIAGRLNSNLFSEIGTQVQCAACNVIKAGNTVLYYKWMLANFGQDVIDDLIRQNDQTHKWVPGELSDLLAKYSALNDANPLTAD